MKTFLNKMWGWYPKPKPNPQLPYAEEYLKRTDEYDERICRYKKGFPITTQERGLCNKNAGLVRRELLDEMQVKRICADGFSKLVSELARSKI